MKKAVTGLAMLLLVFSVFAQETYYIRVATARVRSCPETACSIVARLRRNAPIQVLESVEGAAVSGNTTWYRIQVRNRDGYIHSSLVTNVAPTSSGGNTSTGSSGAANTGASVDTTSQQNPAPVSTEPPPPSPQPQSTSCGGASTCGEMASCDQARACLAAGNGRLDRDNDGVPCESICPGG